MNTILTVRLRSGSEVAAKWYEGEPTALSYANRSQAEKKQQALGSGWVVIQRGRPFYVAKKEQ